MAIRDIRFPTFQPAMRVIAELASEPDGTTSIETNIPHQYKVGLIVRLDIPPVYEAQALSGNTYAIISIVDATSFIIDVNSSRENFIAGASNTQFPQCVPVGEVNEKLNSATYNVLPY